MSQFKHEQPRILVALDFANQEEAMILVNQLSPKLCRLKVGNILFTRYGPPFIAALMEKGFTVFLDLKFHDIPQTVAGACRSAAELGVWMINVHTLGGFEMLQAAREALSGFQHAPWLIGVTILTSLDQDDLTAVGMQSTLPQLVVDLSKKAQQAGLDGVVCSAQEVSLIRANLPQDFVLVTPGIRPLDAASDDQKRTMTPQAAIAAGVDYLVIGRPITQAKEPLQALENIVNSL